MLILAAGINLQATYGAETKQQLRKLQSDETGVSCYIVRIILYYTYISFRIFRFTRTHIMLLTQNIHLSLHTYHTPGATREGTRGGTRGSYWYLG